MVHTYVRLPIHGDLEHFTYISIASYICWKRGFDFLDASGFAYKYKCPGIPDIYVKYQRKIKDEYGTRRFDQYAVIEIETHANSKDTEKKIAQFESAAQGVEMHIVPMNKYSKWRDSQVELKKDYGSEIDWIHAFISKYIPENEVSK